MKYLLSLVVFLFALPGIARVSVCNQEITQSEKNECMSFEKEQSVGRLTAAISEICAGKPKVMESRGGTLHPMLMDECMIRELDKLTGLVKGQNP